MTIKVITAGTRTILGLYVSRFEDGILNFSGGPLTEVATEADLIAQAFLTIIHGPVAFYKVEGSVPEPGTMGLLAMGLLIARGMRKSADPDWA